MKGVSKCLQHYCPWSVEREDVFSRRLLEKLWWSLDHLVYFFIHLSSLWSIQPVQQLWVTGLNQSQEPSMPSQLPIYPRVERSNYSEASCSGTQWSRPGLESTLCWTETPDLEFGALTSSAPYCGCIFICLFVHYGCLCLSVCSTAVELS